MGKHIFAQEYQKKVVFLYCVTVTPKCDAFISIKKNMKLASDQNVEISKWTCTSDHIPKSKCTVDRTKRSQLHEQKMYLVSRVRHHHITLYSFEFMLRSTCSHVFRWQRFIKPIFAIQPIGCHNSTTLAT